MTGEKQSEVYRQETYRWRDDYERLLREENAHLKSELEALRKYVEERLKKCAIDKYEVYADILNRLPK